MKLSKNLSRTLMIAGSLMILLLFVFPLWNITLEAPQYPEPIGMDIWITKITDHNPHDLKNINLMNHYVGMKDIPEHLPEFDIFPIVIISMSILGLVFGLIDNGRLYLLWGVVMIVLGVIGMYDFYLWEYEYGHNLNPKAAIKIPGQAYQPPLIGSKKILNFNAISLPMTGAYFLMSGILMAFVAYFVRKK